jgi:hypothetical protein
LIQWDSPVRGSFLQCPFLEWYECSIVRFRFAFQPWAMGYQLILATVFLAACLPAQDKASNQSLKATFSNLDKEPAPYIPDPSLGYTAPRGPQPNRPTLGAIADFQETYGAPTFAPPVYYPAYPVGIYIGNARHAAPVGHIAGRPVGHGHRR